MKFIINKEVLANCLQKTLSYNISKQTSPILNAILIKATKEEIRITSTDLDVTIISTCSANVITPGEVVIPVKNFAPIIRELPPQEIELEKNKNILLIKCGKIEFKINTFNTEDFPVVQENKAVSVIKIQAQNLKEMFSLTSFCVGMEDVNYVLNGILFEIFENKINLVATDGKRLAFSESQLAANQPEVKTKISFILPIKAANELQKLIKEEQEELYLSIENNRIEFDWANMRFIARPTEGEFPNYQQYIPSEGKDKLVVDRRDFLYALRRASLLSTSDYQGVKIELKKNNIVFSKNTPQLGEAKEEIEAQYSGSHLEIGFNPNYLIDVLKNLEDEKVTISFFGADKPAVLKRENYTYLVLPVKL
ncbi:MAG: DNA polymerase III subunit beta [Candidatus Omnitrophica bacterium]|jgi:DNA polymerase-3 subunit beta|nr:DNA polymerase III subunit beta [Candidatus Omnitrophota bacterium]